VQERKGLPDGVNIPRMAKPLLEEFDVAGRLLRFVGSTTFALQGRVRRNLSTSGKNLPAGVLRIAKSNRGATPTPLANRCEIGLRIAGKLLVFFCDQRSRSPHLHIGTV
jgi:hypothetical protein